MYFGKVLTLLAPPPPPLYRPVNCASKFGFDFKSFTAFETQSHPLPEPLSWISLTSGKFLRYHRLLLGVKSMYLLQVLCSCCHLPPSLRWCTASLASYDLGHWGRFAVPWALTSCFLRKVQRYFLGITHRCELTRIYWHAFSHSTDIYECLLYVWVYINSDLKR